MKRDLKTEILLTAERLFNESGCRAVSMRSIAEALNISVGNLTYHYKRKEDLLEAVAEHQHEYCRALPPPGTFSELDLFFQTVLDRRSKLLLECHNRDDMAQAWQMQQLAAKHIGELLTEALTALTAAGLLRPDPARAAVEQALLGLLLYGRPAELLTGADAEQNRLCLWQLLSLLLTKQGQHELKKLNLE